MYIRQQRLQSLIVTQMSNMIDTKGVSN